MFGFISNIFVAVFIIMNRTLLRPFEIGTLVLLGVLIATVELYLSHIVRYIKHDRNRQSSTGSD